MNSVIGQVVQALGCSRLSTGCDSTTSVKSPFEPTNPDIGKLYYVAQTSLNALAIVTPLTDLGNTDNGADSYLWWTWSQRIRTLSVLPFEVEILVVSKRPLYQIIAAKAIQLKALGLSLRTIAIQLNVDEKTIAKAIQWICKLDNRNSV